MALAVDFLGSCSPSWFNHTTRFARFCQDLRLARALDACMTDYIPNPRRLTPNTSSCACRRIRWRLSNRCWAVVAGQFRLGPHRRCGGRRRFYRHDHRLIFQAIVKLIERSHPADVVTVSEQLEKSAQLGEVGGLAYLATLAQNTPSAANIKRYAEIVRERSIMRQLAQIGTEIADSAYNPMGRDARELLDEAETKVFRIAESTARSQQDFLNMEQILPKWWSG